MGTGDAAGPCHCTLLLAAYLQLNASTYEVGQAVGHVRMRHDSSGGKTTRSHAPCRHRRTLMVCRPLVNAIVLLSSFMF